MSINQGESLLSHPERFAGFDLGTSGARISVIESDDENQGGHREVYSKAVQWDGDYDDAEAWMNAVKTLLQGASRSLDDLQSVKSICVSGTSASCLMVNRKTQTMTRKPRMYNYDVITSAEKSNLRAAKEAIRLLQKHAPPKHTARATTGSLAKLLTWAMEAPLDDDTEVLCHQSDFISMNLIEESNLVSVKSDWHNCLKLGYDVRGKKWPTWLEKCLKDAGIKNPISGNGVIPLEIVSPGEPMGTVSKKVAQSLGLSEDCVVVGGTTDSNAAFFAAAGTSPAFGTAVTSLGSTLAIKQLSQTYIEDADRGVYSHRFPNFLEPDSESWLVGGASNVGCAILKKLSFNNEELDKLSAEIDPMSDSPFSYYPLTKVGERFPVADANKEPVLEPIPVSRKEYLHGLLQSISDIEREGFEVLTELGASPPSTIWTCGGGSRNSMWNKMRENRIASRFQGSKIMVQKAESTEASYGAALLAAATYQ
eukprot:CAMPEP_0194259770 /NCGR_PEP_ID=MMETSP0158-20130606/44351_1 /TAXON_ID=33649 /ORGANISM="Thalassionema nitzschioides, Strain L26-B" /LENGTH=480 /DNA_ID=CAMNT_0038999689 /DNA_START=32 /DNA_END=1474 /DNA_ORIENTATION=+